MAVLPKDIDNLGSDEAAASNNDDLHIRSPICGPPTGLVMCDWRMSRGWPESLAATLDYYSVSLGYSSKGRLSRHYAVDKGPHPVMIVVLFADLLGLAVSALSPRYVPDTCARVVERRSAIFVRRLRTRP